MQLVELLGDLDAGSVAAIRAAMDNLLPAGPLAAVPEGLRGQDGLQRMTPCRLWVDHVIEVLKVLKL